MSSGNNLMTRLLIAQFRAICCMCMLLSQNFWTPLVWPEGSLLGDMY